MSVRRGGSGWTDVADITAHLRKRWATGRYLRAHAQQEPWQPVALPVKAPTATEVLDDFDQVVRWAERFRRDSRNGDGAPRFTVEHRTVRGRTLGANTLPARVVIESFEQLCALLGTASDVEALDAILDVTASRTPELLPWVIEHPMAAIEQRGAWTNVLATVNWMAAHAGANVYLRQIDVAGVDTKFVERNQRVIAQLLSLLLPPDRVDRTQRSFAARHGFREKPHYTRLRLLSPVASIPAPLTELRLRTDELATLDLDVSTVFVIENEISYLALPDTPNAIAIFGEGFGTTALERLPWLHDKELVYWGDIDTHGFAILNRLRARFMAVKSILMDRDTLLAHPTQLVPEPDPIDDALVHLTQPERSLYRDLVEDRFGRSIRLEQERIRFSLVRAALHSWTSQERATNSTATTRGIGR
jgi:hypothetical protein